MAVAARFFIFEYVQKEMPPIKKIMLEDLYTVWSKAHYFIILVFYVFIAEAEHKG